MVPTNDYVFKRIFGHIGNENITMGLLNAILNLPIEKINLDENRILERDVFSDKLGILDIKATINNNIVVNIEMQVVNYFNIFKRLMFYWGKAYNKEIQKGEEYDNLKKTIVIFIADFEIDNLELIPKYHTKWQIREEDFPKILLTDVFELHIIELPKLNKLIKKGNKYENKSLELWIKFLLTPEEMEVREMEDNKAIKEAKEVLDEISQNEREEYLAELREKHILDYNSSHNEGIRKGIEETKKETAKKMLELNLDIETIMKVTELTKEEIEKLR